MKRVAFLCIAVVINILVRPQEVVEWKWTANKIADKTYEIHLTPTVKKPWHIYSQTSPVEGGLPTTVSFNQNPLVVLEGKTKEIGKLVSKYEDVFEVTVKYLEGKIDFVQIVKLKTNVKTNISGSIQYMACNDGQCLPPQRVSFTVKLE